MRRAVRTGLPPETAPFSHAVVAGGWLHTATLPVRPDGTLETGGGAAQAEAALANLRRTVEAAGATLDDVGQVVVYLTRLEDKPAMDEVYA
jgi:enamine deaminase RidA (YjgF/YER057c/UK114 family)